jgi:nuclear mRNA export protein PCID2/THP1
MTLLDTFLTQIRAFVRAQDGDQLAAWLKVENVSQEYNNLANDLRAQFRAKDSAALEKTVERLLPEDDDVPEGQATPWPGFVTFIKDYLQFWRNVDFSDLLGAHALLTGLVKCVCRSTILQTRESAQFRCCSFIVQVWRWRR